MNLRERARQIISAVPGGFYRTEQPKDKTPSEERTRYISVVENFCHSPRFRPFEKTFQVDTGKSHPVCLGSGVLSIRQFSANVRSEEIPPRLKMALGIDGKSDYDLNFGAKMETPKCEIVSKLAVGKGGLVVSRPILPGEATIWVSNEAAKSKVVLSTYFTLDRCLPKIIHYINSSVVNLNGFDGGKRDLDPKSHSRLSLETALLLLISAENKIRAAAPAKGRETH